MTPTDPNYPAPCCAPTPPLPCPSSPPSPPTPICSLECRREEALLSALQARDMRLRPHLMHTCAPELALFCGNEERTGAGGLWWCGC